MLNIKLTLTLGVIALLLVPLSECSNLYIRHMSKLKIIKEASKNYKQGPSGPYMGFSGDLSNNAYGVFYSHDLKVTLHPEDNGYTSMRINGPFVPIIPHSYKFYENGKSHLQILLLIETKLDNFKLNSNNIILEYKKNEYGLSKVFGPVFGNVELKDMEYFRKHNKANPVSANNIYLENHEKLSDVCSIDFHEFADPFRAQEFADTLHETDDLYCYLLDFNIHNINPKNTFYITFNGFESDNRNLGQLKVRFSNKTISDYKAMDIHM